ncbi:MAG TPA: TonB-dependent receptor plug domain-containing protein [Micropepsaceae bacterium]|nr:TonB-dependent receptor plug domain-containing protein [Micropepsaceae bacterium]
MNTTASKLTSLLGSASLLAMFGAAGSHAQQLAQAQSAQAGPAEVPEQVLVTGSLIRGTVAVGTPVTNLGPQDFTQTGSLTAAELFRTVPAAVVSPGPVGTNNGGNIGRETEVSLRGLDSSGGYPVRGLMMVDGVRFPPQGEHSGQRDPSIIPTLALDRIDILVDGASATYGSDAVTGVINIILKRGYDGAVTQLQSTFADGRQAYQASQLFGRTWDGGDITLTYQWSDQTQLKGSARSNFTLNFTPWGLDNRTPVASSLPPTISTGNAATPATARGIGTICSNCFALPAGSGANFDSSLNNGLGPLAPSSGPGVLTWSSLGTAANAGTNEFNPYSIGDYLPATQQNNAVLTVDQRITGNVSFYGEGFYDNRRFEYLNLANQSPASTQDMAVQVPTLNPYYPIGAPTNLVVNYNIGTEIPPFTDGSEIADRYLGGIKFDLPANWEGRVYYSGSYDASHTASHAVNQNAVSAALGWTIPAGTALGTAPGIASWTKPATIPYLNLFCDPRAFACNSPATLNYITASRIEATNFWINETGANFDGALFSLPGGDVKAAAGGLYTNESWSYSLNDDTKTPSLLTPPLGEAKHLNFWAAFIQLNVPLIGEANAIPLVRQLEVEASWRHDQYSDFGGTSNPKIGFNWTISQDYGLILRGDWGTSFRAPGFAEQSAIVGDIISGINVPNFAANRAVSLNCNADPNSLAGRLLNPGAGFIGWNGVVGNNGKSGTTCGSLALPTGIGTFSTGGVAIQDGFRKYVNTAQNVLRPETAMNYDFTAEFAPTAFLRGLDIQASWYQLKINNALQQFGNPSNSSVNNPVLGFSYIVPTDIAKAGVDVAGCSNNNTPSACPEFENIVRAVLNDPQNAVPANALTSVLWVNDGAIGNWGWIKLQGIDFSASYDFDAGDLGAFNTGITGTYYLHQLQANNPSAAVPNPPVTDLFNTDAGVVGGVDQAGVPQMPRMRYRARLGWSDGTWSAAGFVNYVGHYFNTQNAPPNVNFQCTAAGGTVGGGTFPCFLANYTGIEPAWYTFDLSLGYNTGELPASPWLQHIGLQLVIQNIMNKLPAFEYQIASGSAPAAFDVTESDLGRTFGIILTKTW